MVIIHAYIHVKEDALDDVLEQMKPLIATTTQEPGNISYSLYRDINHANVLIMVEEWKDEQAIAIHDESSHLLHFLTNTKSFLTQPIQLNKYTVLT
ncbi:putative quinol monooxygenase [Paenibacillus sp. SYP-B3998]|nr:putative quinol monooxygenase [Paenibacillus sp. SYP-B3998]